MKYSRKIPIVVGVTGHRNICEGDVALLKRQVADSLVEIKKMCNDADSPVVMISGMAQGADMICAEAAFENDVPVYAALPCPKEQFIKSFNEGPDRDKLYEYLDKCARVIEVPDVEQKKEWLQSKVPSMDDDSYWYRQVGAYIALSSHVLIALWDGKAPTVSYGCGTVEVMEFALERNYLNKDYLYKPGKINDTAVIWIKTNRNRNNGAYVADGADKEWLTSDGGCSRLNVPNDEGYYKRFKSSAQAPAFLTDTVNKTVEYNKAECTPDDWCHLWADVDELDDYRKNLREHYIKADKLSYAVNQPKYRRNMLALAVLGALIAFAFLLYDDASLIWMMIPCTVAAGIIIALSFACQKKAYHSNYINYRAFAEALRIQFYLTLSLDEPAGLTSVCDLYSWSQKNKFMWIRKALRAIEVVSDSASVKRDAEFLNKVKEAWVGNGVAPEGQLRYHLRKKRANKTQRDKLNAVTQALTWTTVVLYGTIFVFEAITFFRGLSGKTFFWSGDSPIGLSYRSIGTIVVGTLAATSLLLSSYWGKLSFDRLYDDNDKMSKLYQSAYARWTEVTQDGVRSPKEFENFVKEIAREEIVENGIWCSYIEQNTLDINL